MSKVEILKEARRLIKTRAEDFVCVAIRMSHVEAPPEDYHQLRKWIRSMLEGHYVLDDWVEENVPGATEVYLWKEKLRVTRLAWIDWMIQQLEEKL